MANIKVLAAFGWRLLRTARIGGILLQIHPKSYLRRRGWFRSFSDRKSVDLKGAQIPWWSYGAVDFIEQRLISNMVVLEFGSGASTAWFASRVAYVISVENNAVWAAKVREIAPGNVSIIVLSDPGAFRASHLSFSKDAVDVLVVDALADRVACARAGLRVLSPEGVVVWDNTDGPDWPQISLMMADEGFKEISFSGLAPQEVVKAVRQFSIDLGMSSESRT